MCARRSDNCRITTVLIGEVGGGGLAVMHVNALNSLRSNLSGPVKTIIGQVIAFKEAARNGDPLVHDSTTCAICAKNSQHIS
ncbi:MAG: hypothetical protein ABI280_10515 [Ginsengibacter sp.]